jgi:hypothetical protein
MNTFFVYICILLVLSVSAGASTFYVSPKGNDQFIGSKIKPFASIGKAVEKAREEPGAHIVVGSGRYFLDSPISLDSRDSGLIIEASKGVHPELIGGRIIRGWKRDGDTFWSAPVPKAINREWDFRMLVVNGTPRKRARLPETGYFEHLSVFDVPWMSTSAGGWKRKPTDIELTTLKYKPSDLGPWLDVNNAELTVYHMWDESVVGLIKNDAATQTLTFSNAAGHPAGAFDVHKYLVWNVREGMKKPGQWYLDRTVGKVVYWPLPGEDMTKAEVLAPTMESIIRINGTNEAPANNITLNGLSLSVTNTPLKTGGFGAGEFDGAISMVYAHDCTLSNLTITNVAGQGVRTWETNRLRVERSKIYNAGACGIRVYGINVNVADNYIHDIGIIYPSAIGVSGGGPNSVAEHNEVYNTPYSAFAWGGESSRVESNLIYHAMQELHDGAGIYVSGSKGAVMRGNLIRDIDDTGGYGASAYYLDEQCESCIVENNLALRVAKPTQNHMARKNIIRNNVFVMTGDSLTSFARCSDYIYEHNVLYAGGAIKLQAPEGGFKSMANNIIYSAIGKVEFEVLNDYSGIGAKPLEPKDGNVLTDPLFVNAKHDNFAFKAKSPALALGIKPLDLRDVGVRKK